MTAPSGAAASYVDGMGDGQGVRRVRTSASYVLYLLSVVWRNSADSFFASSLVCLTRFVRSGVTWSVSGVVSASGRWRAIGSSRTLLGCSFETGLAGGLWNDAGFAGCYVTLLNDLGSFPLGLRASTSVLSPVPRR